jgi:hypothetical protein
MKALRFIAISFLLLSGFYQFLFAQSNSDTIPKFEAGIDFIRFNRNWIYYSNQLEPTDGNLYNFDLIPSLFLKLPIKKMALRFKYEFFKKPYSFETSSIDTYQEIDGNLIENRISFGLERYLNHKKFRLSYIIDFGVSFSDFKGLYSYNDVINNPATDPFNINGITLFVQPGLGVKYRLSDKFDLNLESALWLGKGYDSDDNHNINPDLRIIPRPISLFGLSYKFR